MNKVVVLALLWLPVMGWGQTVEIEAAYLNKQIAEKKWTPAQMQERSRIWRELRGSYPILPYDSVRREIYVKQIIHFPGITKAQAFKRVKEWGALNFTDLESVIDYEDLETGKIILEGWQRVWFSATLENLWGNIKSFPDERRLLFSLVVTIKDGSAKVEYKNLKYKQRIAGYYAALTNIYIPAQEYVYPVILSFPLVDSSPDKWEGAIDLIKETMRVLNATAPDLEQYIKAVGDDYRF